MEDKVLCGACGYENQTGHRFCGMCGTPLPHRPLTAPGAHGTYTFMRLPQESAKVEVPAERKATSASARGGILIEMPRSEQPQIQDETPPPEMVPEIPLDEYIKSFRYAPPVEPDETTMRGETHVPQVEAATITEEGADVATDAASPVDGSSKSATHDVEARLGLEDLVPPEERQDRTRFLDLSEPTSPAPEPKLPQPSISGPSFLGLATLDGATVAHEDGRGTKFHDSLWTGVAVAALVAFVSLGVLEWRAQGSQTSPVEIVKMKLWKFWHRDGSLAPQTNMAEAIAKPPTQFEGQSKPQGQDENAASSGPQNGSQASQPNSAPSSQNAAPVTQPEQGDVRKSPQGTSSQSPTRRDSQSEAPMLNVTKDAAGSQTVKSMPKTAPGDEELAKANEASDVAAAAAWLWKATGKGNRDAPVRLADIYVKGDGVPRSCDQALVLLRAAAIQQNALARNRLAAMYNSGTCVQRNRVEAYRWVTSALSADPNNQWALENRDLIWQQLTPEEQAAAKAKR